MKKFICLFIITKNTKMNMNELSLDDLFQQIQEQAKLHPNYINTIITDLHSIINKFDPEIQSGKKDALPLIDPSFKSKVKLVKERIFTVLEKKIKIPDLRFEADRIAQEINIPLPNSTRKNNEALMQWFDSNWDLIEPKLRELKGKSDIKA